MENRIWQAASKIWDYHKLNHQIEPADAVLVLCSHDERVAERSVELYQSGLAPLVIFSGGSGSITSRLWQEPEADRFARIAIANGVPKEKVLTETKSTNTGENILFTKEMLDKLGLEFRKFVLVQKPYMERRSYATFRKLWPEKEVMVTSPQISFEEYLQTYANRSLTSADVIGIMVGDLQRIRLYPASGFQIEQEVPPDVLAAFDELVTAGFTKYLIQS